MNFFSFWASFYLLKGKKILLLGKEEKKEKRERGEKENLP